MRTFYNYINKKILGLKKINLYREMKTASVIKGNEVLINGNHCVNFSSNDYLGLSQHPEVIQKTIDGIKEFGVGAGASRLISGNREYHTKLEEELALFKGKEACLLFGSGYLANLSLLSTLPTSHDLVLSDELNHASIIDGCKLSRAKIVSYPHNNMNWLNDFLESNRGKYTNVFIVSDAIFSMDGDIISLRDLYEISNIFETIPILDEAHSTGVIGLNGRGIESYYNIENPNSIIMGTLGKALGSYGAFVCGKKELIDFLINKSRTFIFTTALPPAPVISATVALELIKKNAQIHFQLRENVKYFVNCLLQSGIEVFSKSAIIPIIIGKADITMSISDDLLRNGVYMQGIRPPTVSKDASRIRITMSSTHTEKQLNNALNILVDTLKKYGII